MKTLGKFFLWFFAVIGLAVSSLLAAGAVVGYYLYKQAESYACRQYMEEVHAPQENSRRQRAAVVQGAYAALRNTGGVPQGDVALAARELSAICHANPELSLLKFMLGALRDPTGKMVETTLAGLEIMPDPQAEELALHFSGMLTGGKKEGEEPQRAETGVSPSEVVPASAEVSVTEAPAPEETKPAAVVPNNGAVPPKPAGKTGAAEKPKAAEEKADR